MINSVNLLHETLDNQITEVMIIKLFSHVSSDGVTCGAPLWSSAGLGE